MSAVKKIEFGVAGVVVLNVHAPTEDKILETCVEE
jgi:hypothetical protein